MTSFTPTDEQSSIVERRRHKLPPGECMTCDHERELKNDFHPSHDATKQCQSGKHNHCSCDTCF